MFTRIVVGVDCCEGGRDALTLAMQLQSAGGGELVAVHACAPGPLLRGDVLTRVEAQLARVGATGRARAVADHSPAHTLRMAAEREGAELIVIGSSHLAGAERILAGDDTAATLHCAPGAVAVAVAPRGFARTPGTLRRIGVGLDGSEKSRVALALACRLAHQTGARVRATTVVPVRMPRWPKPALDPEWSGYEEAAHQLDERLLAGVAVELDIDVTPEVVVGTAWKELASRSVDLDLLVVGGSACGPVRRLLFGSTSTKLARHAACPLLVAPQGARNTADEPRIATRARPARPATATPLCDARELGTRAHARIAAAARRPG
jgi:nucleotide-binding universal stress UspA family protein